MTNNTSQLEKKLEQAIKARTALETAHKQQMDVLSQFAARLSLSCKGQDVALDNQLAKFRSALGKGINFEEFLPLIESINGALKQQESINSANQRQLTESVTDAGKQLQKQKGIPEDARRMLRFLLDHELGQVNATNDFLPLLDKLVKIYQKTLSAKNNQSAPLLANNQQAGHPEIAKELLSLANELVFDDDVAKEVTGIKNTISLSDNINTLLEAAVSIIRIVANSIARERQSAQGFLVSLNQTLEELHTSIVSTTKHSHSMNKELSGLNKRIESKIKNLNEQTQKATSISELKALVDDELKQLSQDLVEREKLEQKDKEALFASFDKINDRIGALESKVSNYKKRLSEQQFKSLLDGLTKLPNRAAFDDRLNQEFQLFEQHANETTLVVIDVDFFKSINDQYGHSAGDKTLQVLARALKKAIRKSDFIARYGGEEFVLLMPGMPLKQAKVPLEKIRNTIKAIPFKFKDKQVQITVSLGATQFKKGDSPIGAFDRADDALYEAKNSGRDRVCLRE